jgi:hypothetical protein
MTCFILIKNIIIITVMLIGLKYLPIKAKQKYLWRSNCRYLIGTIIIIPANYILKNILNKTIAIIIKFNIKITTIFSINLEKYFIIFIRIICPDASHFKV